MSYSSKPFHVGKQVSRREINKDNAIINLLPQAGRLFLFEASAGKGRLSNVLHQAGHKVTVSNFKIAGNLPFEEIYLDLNQPDIHIPNAPFDAIICREVIEHVENIPHVLRVLGTT
jgi:2-polyprenyl-3-methyl-5-hydroxy-6-metoxy-1,4-benzoquinol methylase